MKPIQERWVFSNFRDSNQTWSCELLQNSTSCTSSNQNVISKLLNAKRKNQPIKPLKNNLKIVQQNIQTRIFQENGKQTIFTRQPRGFHYEENKWDKKLSEALGRIAGCRFCYASNKQLSLFHHRIQPNLSQGVTSATLKLHSEERQMNTFKAV